jgi:hypothetical protein
VPLGCTVSRPRTGARPATKWAVRVTVVIPLPDGLAGIECAVPLLPHWVDELVLLDGGTAEHALEAAQRRLPGVRLERGRGAAAGLRGGLAPAGDELLVVADAAGALVSGTLSTFVQALLRASGAAGTPRSVRDEADKPSP